MLSVDVAIFYAAWVVGGPFPSHIPLEALDGIGIVSLYGAGAYVTAIALYHARILESKSELEREARGHRRTAEALAAAKDAADAAARAKAEFLATMSHELRTPLNAIIGFSDVILAERFGPLANARYLHYAKDINRSGAHLLEIVNDILEIAKAESGRLELAEEVVDIPLLAKGMEALFADRVEETGIRFDCVLPDFVPLLRADERRVKQMLVSLLDYAFKFTPQGGAVRLAAAAQPRRGLAIVVEDTGIGFDPKLKPRLVEAFFQADSSLARRHEGTGLGLPIVDLIIRAHGGTLELEPRRDCRGTRATITFPRERLVRSEADLPSEMLPLLDAAYP
jgi:signal transduction histidine kinase